MSAIKQKLLALHTRRLIKKSQTVRVSVGYAQAQRIGILYTQGDAEKKEAVQALATQMQEMGKELDTLCYIAQAGTAQPEVCPTLTPAAISLWGRARDAAVHRWLTTPFDYLYHVDAVSDPVLDYCLAACQAKCRVGLLDMCRVGLFEIMVALASSKPHTPSHLMEVMLHYTKQLHV